MAVSWPRRVAQSSSRATRRAPPLALGSDQQCGPTRSTTRAWKRAVSLRSTSPQERRKGPRRPPPGHRSRQHSRSHPCPRSPSRSWRPRRFPPRPRRSPLHHSHLHPRRRLRPYLRSRLPHHQQIRHLRLRFFQTLPPCPPARAMTTNKLGGSTIKRGRSTRASCEPARETNSHDLQQINHRRAQIGI